MAIYYVSEKGKTKEAKRESKKTSPKGKISKRELDHAGKKEMIFVYEKLKKALISRLFF